MSDVVVNYSGVASQIDIRACVREVQISRESAISQWIDDVILMNRLSTSLMGGDHDVTLGQMLVAQMVGSTENYFRTVFADLANTCPWVARNVALESIPFSAVRTFATGKAGYGLVEGVLFSSKGVIAKQFKRFTKYQIAEETALGKAVATFDSVCAIRHASVHWSGRFDTRAHGTLRIDDLGKAQYGVALDLAAIQDSLAACDFLVRSSNQVLFDHTMKRWLDEGYLGVDVSAADSRSRVRALSAIFAERRLKSVVSRRIAESAASD
ncbi:hypothetical protein [Allobranchiibius sp. CTAmp26]|uniref:hypothetical protein n=1 Tax=Allobranchiibius sp. CTAmp26 TaxID=2815214 RepID=UPI001AA11E27|nr:hypothetical protein [Allobranchiibius sp. CTAmp26]MBO1756680.1 hypothetical protein [Allobranchiibius sp. CTAmp26]